MKKVILVLIVLAAVGFSWWWFGRKQASINQIPGGTMKFTSSAFFHNGFIPKEYSCDGAGEHPPLQWSGVPTEAKSLALIVDDPDAPRGLWTHWLLWNIDPKMVEIKTGVVPAEAVQGKTSSGENFWGSPCPPSGTHHYRFKLFALDTIFTLSSKTVQKDLETALQGHTLDQAELVGLYARVNK